MDQECTYENDHLIMPSYCVLGQNTTCCEVVLIRFFIDDAKSDFCFRNNLERENKKNFLTVLKCDYKHTYTHIMHL